MGYLLRELAAVQEALRYAYRETAQELITLGICTVLEHPSHSGIACLRAFANVMKPLAKLTKAFLLLCLRYRKEVFEALNPVLGALCLLLALSFLGGHESFLVRFFRCHFAERFFSARSLRVVTKKLTVSL